MMRGQLSMVTATCILVAGCGPYVTDVRGPDGETAHIIRCRASESCYEKADEICPGGYVLRSTAVSSDRYGTASEILASCKSDLGIPP